MKKWTGSCTCSGCKAPEKFELSLKPAMESLFTCSSCNTNYKAYIQDNDVRVEVFSDLLPGAKERL